MAAPINITQTGPGASGHNDNIVIGTFTQDSETKEDMLFVHCAMLPKMVWLKNETETLVDDDPATYPPLVGVWIDTMPALSFLMKNTATTVVFVTGTNEGIMAWDSSVTRNPDAQQDGSPTGTAGYGVIPLNAWYLKEGAAYQSGTFVQDVIIGFKVTSVDYPTGKQLLGTAGDLFHYVVFG